MCVFVALYKRRRTNKEEKSFKRNGTVDDIESNYVGSEKREGRFK